MTTTAAPRQILRCPPTPDTARSRLRAAAGAGELGYGALKLRRTGHGWYHVALGLRQIAQARLGAAGAFSPSADAAVDGIHIASMLVFAAVRPSHRRTALLGAANAAGWAALDAWLSRRPPVAPGDGAEAPVRRTRA